MNQYITLFVALAIIIGIGTFVISTSYDSIALPNTSTVPAVPASSPPEPDAISGLTIWLDADDSATISIGVGVSQWDDKSGNFNNVTNAVGGQQPIVVTGDLNGHDIIRFDSADDYLRTLTYTGGAITQPNTVISVLRGEPAGSTGYYYDSGTIGARHSLYQVGGTPNIGIHAGSSQTSAHLSDAVNYHLYTVVFDTTDEVFEDTVSVWTADAGADTMQGVAIGSHYGGGGNAGIDIAEFLVYDRILTADELNDITDYVEVKYELGLNLTGEYSAGSPAVAGEGTGWSLLQTTLNTQSQAATALITVTLIVLAAVVVIFVARRMNN